MTTVLAPWVVAPFTAVTLAVYTPAAAYVWVTGLPSAAVSSPKDQ
jgi:hypothetical protein